MVVLLLALGGGGGAWWYFQNEESKAAAEQQAQNAVDEKGRAAAMKYMQAIADSDADTAYNLLHSPPTRSPLMSNAALEASNKAKPIENITVTESDLFDNSGRVSGTVTLSYTMGGAEQTSVLSITTDTSGKVGIGGGLGMIELTLPQGFKATINGVEVADGSHLVFPGMYTLASANQWFDVTGAEPFTFGSTEFGRDLPTGVMNPTVELSSAGDKEFRNQMTAAFTECTKAKDLAPSGCPWSLSPRDGGSVDSGSIVYTVRDPGWASKVDLEVTGMNVSADISVPMHISATGKKANGQATTFESDFDAEGVYRMDMSSDSPRIDRP